MPLFRLTGSALRDVAEIIAYQHSHHSTSAADDMESRLFQAFRDLAESPHMGHRRSDLTPKDVMFHYAQPYFILFRRMKTRTQVLRVAHESRDLRKFL
jgi:plasmid stabilization system protein ParE